MNFNVLTKTREMADQLRSWRRHLHAHPELSGEEDNTSAYVAAELARMGYRPIEKIGGTYGLTARLEGPPDVPAVALRADMDALPIQEENPVEYASRHPGVMHACGHDAHTAMLLGAARLLSEQRDRLRCPVVFLFQPSEEVYPGGAQPMIAAGVLEGVGEVFGLHITSRIPTGTLGTRVGALMSGVNDLEIVVRGRSEHATMPEQTADPVVAAAHLIVALQTVVSRSVAMTDSAVVSVTQLDAGTADNVIPELVRLRGTVRTLDEQVRARVCQRIGELAEHVARAFGCRAEVGLRPSYPPLINDGRVVNFVQESARRAGFGESDLLTLPPQGGGEDFAYYCQQVPGAFAFLGARNDAKDCIYPHHHPRFDIDEDALPLGAALLAQFALDAHPDRLR
jgi:amidohydrolase